MGPKRKSSGRSQTLKVEKEQELDKAENLELRLGEVEDRLFRTKAKCDLLQAENRFYKDSAEKAAVDEEDIVEFLRGEMQRIEQRNSELEVTIRLMEQKTADLLRASQAEMTEKLGHANHEVGKWERKATQHKADFDQLLEFKGKREAMEEEIRRLEREINDRDRAHKSEVHAMERKFLQDKSQLRKEMLSKVTEAVASFKRVAEQQMADTTKRAIRENLAVSAQLKKMSAKTVDLIEENKSLKEKIVRIRIENSLLTDAEKRVLRKSETYLRLVQELTMKLKESDRMVEKVDGTVSKELQETVTALKDRENSIIREELEHMRKKYANLQTKMNEAEDKLRSTSELVSEVTEFMLSAVKARELTTSSTQSATVVSREFTPESAAAITPQENNELNFVPENIKESTIENKQKVLRYLLSTLEISIPQSRPTSLQVAASHENMDGLAGESPASSADRQHSGGKIKLRPLTVPVRFRETRLVELPDRPPLPAPQMCEADGGPNGPGRRLSTTLSPFPVKGNSVSDNLRAIRHLHVSGKVRKARSRNMAAVPGTVPRALVTMIPYARAEGELRPITAGSEESEREVAVTAKTEGATRTVVMKSVAVQTRNSLGEPNTQLLLARVRSDVRPWGNPLSHPPATATMVR